MKILLSLTLVLLCGLSACATAGSVAPPSGPRLVDAGEPSQLDALSGQLADTRAIFIGEIHDRLEHHQNQLRIIQGLYQRNPDLSIGLEYFQHSFQPYLDDYIAGRIDERDMLRKTEYFKRWLIDYRLIQPIVHFAREKHIPLLALNVSDEIHNKVFRTGMSSLTPSERALIPQTIRPASEHYLQRLRLVFSSHPTGPAFATFVDGVLLWDEYMADTAARHLIAHPESRMVVLAGMVHVMYGDGIPERLNQRLGGPRSAVLLNGNDFANYPGIADYLLATRGSAALPASGKLGVMLSDEQGMLRITGFTPGSAALVTGMAIGDRITALNGVKVSNIPELKSLLFDKQPAERMTLLVQRDSSPELRFEVVLR